MFWILLIVAAYFLLRFIRDLYTFGRACDLYGDVIGARVAAAAGRKPRWFHLVIVVCCVIAAFTYFW